MDNMFWTDRWSWRCKESRGTLWISSYD